MRCTTCEFVNRAGRRFCAACGAPLNVPCGSCGFINEVGESYCGGCGRLLISEPAADGAVTRDAGPEGDRRPVTVMFCDLVGYTRLSSVLDPEDVHALLERFFALVDAIVDRHGGTIDKHIGDAVMALFGAPTARGNDTERAVRAALDIQVSVPRLASGLPSALAVHIGIATGEVVASSVGSDHHRGYTVTGEAANIAARLLDKADSEETLVSGLVHAATHHIFTYEPLGSLPLKGLTHPVEAWRLRGARNSTPDAGALVGRRSELGQFRAVLDACIHGRSGTAVLIRGEAGIGKTRLMDELKAIAASSGMACSAGYVLDFGTQRGQGAVRMVVAGLLGLSPDAATDAVESAINAILREGDLQPDEALFLRDLLEMPQPDSARKQYEAMDAAARAHGKARVIAGLAQVVAARRPLLITVEDIHWADPETLGLLAAITRATAESRTVLVMTSRIDGDPIDAHWRGIASGGSMISVDLPPLSAEESQVIARRLIEIGQFTDQCIERAGGNPLFLEQLLRGARDLTDGRLPASVQSVVLARTDLLSTQDRRAIQAASVLGQRFSLAHLRALLRDPGYTCDTLVRNVLLRPTSEGLQFAHALVRDGVYGSLTHARKREWHGAAATLFSDDPVLRAEHLDRAGDPEAAHAYLAAARAQASQFRQDQAIALAERGRALATTPGTQYDIAMLVGALQLDAGRGTEGLAAYEQALAVAADDAERCRALVGGAAANRLIARTDAAFASLADAEPLALALGDDRALAEIHYLRGNLHFARGQLTACRDEHELALDAARRVQAPEWQARALSGLADALYMDCRMVTALAHFATCVDLCETHELTRIAVPNRVMMGHCRIYTCAFDLGLRDMRLGLDAAIRTGNRHAVMFATQSMGLCLTAAGRYNDADAFQSTALEQARAINARRYEAIILGQCAEVALALGRREDALSLARQGRQISDETSPGFAGPILCGLLALLEDTREDQCAALASGEALLGQGAVGHNHVWFRRYAIEWALRLRDWNEVIRQADALRLRMSAEPLAYARLVAERGHCLARRGLGDSDDACEETLTRLAAEAADAGFLIDALGHSLH